MASAMFSISDQQILQRTIFKLITSDEAKQIKSELPCDEDDGYDTDEVIEAFAEFAQQKYDDAVNAGKIPEPFDSIVQVCLEVVDWENHPDF